MSALIISGSVDASLRIGAEAAGIARHRNRNRSHPARNEAMCCGGVRGRGVRARRGGGWPSTVTSWTRASNPETSSNYFLRPIPVVGPSHWSRARWRTPSISTLDATWLMLARPAEQVVRQLVAHGICFAFLDGISLLTLSLLCLFSQWPVLFWIRTLVLRIRLPIE